MKKITLKNSLLGVAALALAVSAGPSPASAFSALVADLGTSINSDTTIYTNTSVNGKTQGSASGSVGAGVNANANTTGTSTTNTNSSTGGNGTASMNTYSSANANVNANANTSATVQSETYRSAVSRFINNVISIANRQPEISAQVRTLVQAEDNSNSATVEAMSEVESRGVLRTFLFGPAYRSLAYLRDQYDQRAERIQELRNIAASASAQVRADLNAQIDAYVESQADMNAFIEEHEGRFSLFGWLVRLFQ